MKRIFSRSLNLYQRFISGAIKLLFGGSCRYLPTCSQYAKEAVGRFGIIKGTSLAVKRLLRCQPWGGSGVDPVPRAKN